MWIMQVISKAKKNEGEPTVNFADQPGTQPILDLPVRSSKWGKASVMSGSSFPLGTNNLYVQYGKEKPISLFNFGEADYAKLAQAINDGKPVKIFSNVQTAYGTVKLFQIMGKLIESISYDPSSSILTVRTKKPHDFISDKNATSLQKKTGSNPNDPLFKLFDEMQVKDGKDNSVWRIPG